jgi:pilus assembly protein Flp/PilA
MRASYKGGMLLMHAKVQFLIAQVLSDEEGQGLTEYALILGLIAVVAIVAATFLGGSVSKVLGTVASSMVPNAP